MANNSNSGNSQFNNQNKYKEFFRLHFLQSDKGVWLAQFDRPMPINLPFEKQEDHLLKHAFLSDCNLAFVKMYGYDDPKDLLGARFPQLFDNAEPSNLDNLRLFLKSGYVATQLCCYEIGKRGVRKYFLNDAIGIVEDDHLIRIWGMQQDITAEKSKKEEDHKILQQLTPQELAILKHTVDGKSLKEIGNAIGVNPKTVDSLRNRMKTKLGVSSLSQLMFLAFRLGLHDLET